MLDTRNYDVGVLVGRFQVPYLHEGHKLLIDHVNDRHAKVVIILGVSEGVNTTNNPLDFESRRQMIHEYIPNAIVLYVKDTADDDVWSKNLDRVVRDVITPGQSVVLYGSRDSFISAYTGSFDTYELLQEGYMSGTEIRNEVRRKCRPSEDFRAGVIWASANRFPIVYSTVDIAIFNLKEQMGLGKKHGRKQWCLIGGFADVDSESFEHDAYREAMEEAAVGFMSPLQYIGSFPIEDWRYAKEPDTVRTTLFYGVTTDIGRAGDDIEFFEWFAIERVQKMMNSGLIIESHVPLIKKALEFHYA